MVNGTNWFTVLRRFRDERAADDPAARHLREPDSFKMLHIVSSGQRTGKT
jgi:hypothetical protein